MIKERAVHNPFYTGGYTPRPLSLRAKRSNLIPLLPPNHEPRTILRLLRNDRFHLQLLSESFEKFKALKGKGVSWSQNGRYSKKGRNILWSNIPLLILYISSLEPSRPLSLQWYWYLSLLKMTP